MKWFFMLGSLLRPLLFDNSSIANPMDDLKSMIKENATKLVFLLATVISLAIVLAAGIIIVALDLGMQFDQNGAITLSAILVAGFILIGISVCAWAIVLNTVKAERAHRNPPLKTVGSAHPLQDALALLVVDFVKAREENREIKRAALYDHAPRYSSQYDESYRQ